MSRQDIYATLSDDVMGEKGSTSSRRGKVKWVRVVINTDVAGQGMCFAEFHKEKNNVQLNCSIPKKWDTYIHKKED